VKSDQHSVAVIIVSHNYGHDLARAVQSVFAQTYPPVAVAILDVGSEDNTWAVAQQIARDNPPVPVQLLQLPNVGPSVARNRGVELTQSDFILFLDADDYLAPEYLQKTVPLLAGQPRVSLVYVDSQMFGDQIGRWSIGPYDFQRLCRENLFNYCVLLRREAFVQVGGFDEDNFGYYEDWELWIRLGKHGWDAIQLYEPLFFYQSHGTTSLMSYSKRLDKIYRAYITARHPELYTTDQVTAARELLTEAPAGWHRRPPMKGVANMQRLVREFPDNRHTLYFLGLACIHECRHSAAVVALEHLLQLYPDDQEAQLALRKARRLAPYAGELPAGAVAHMQAIKRCLQRNDFPAARDELARCVAETLAVPAADPRARQVANIAMNHLLDSAEDWQRLAEDRERYIHELRGWINELNKGKSWLEKQWKYWENKSREPKPRWWSLPSRRKKNHPAPAG